MEGEEFLKKEEEKLHYNHYSLHEVIQGCEPCDELSWL